MSLNDTHKLHSICKMSDETVEIFTSDSICFTCKCFISEPYVRCAVCDYVLICAACFATGREKAGHKNHHDYMIISNDFSLIEGSGWSAKDEKSLLDFILDSGFGNWLDVSHRLPGKSPEDCKRHYLQNYIDNQHLSGLPKIEETDTSLFGTEPIPYAFNLDLEDPPRLKFGSVNYKFMAGYSAARSDFETNFDNHAELLIANLKYKEFHTDYPYCKLGKSLQLALVGAYNTRLNERSRRSKVIRDHGLISLRKSVGPQQFNASMTRTLRDRLRIFMQLLNGIEFDSIMEYLYRLRELKIYLRELLEYRKNGIQHFHSVPVFKELFELRQKIERDKKQHAISVEYNSFNGISSATSEHVSMAANVSRRKAPPPIDIHPGMVGFAKLSVAERELCSLARVLPDAYIDIKHLLISENKKYGSVKLVQARQLLKMDVNKTKKIHEFLAREGYINGN